MKKPVLFSIHKYVALAVGVLVAFMGLTAPTRSPCCSRYSQTWA